MPNPKPTAGSSIDAVPVPAELPPVSQTVTPVKAPRQAKVRVATEPKSTGSTRSPARNKAAKTVVAPEDLPAAETKAPPASPQKHHKPRAKLVRDGFTMPEEDFALIGELKKRLLANAREAKKSELLRAGLRVLNGLSDAALIDLFDQLDRVKTGRPKKGH